MTAIKSIRNRLGMSQESLGKALGKTKAAISHYESGRYQIPVHDAKSLIVIAKEFGIEISLDDVFIDVEMGS